MLKKLFLTILLFASQKNFCEIITAKILNKGNIRILILGDKHNNSILSSIFGFQREPESESHLNSITNFLKTISQKTSYIFASPKLNEKEINYKEEDDGISADELEKNLSNIFIDPSKSSFSIFFNKWILNKWKDWALITGTGIILYRNRNFIKKIFTFA